MIVIRYNLTFIANLVGVVSPNLDGAEIGRYMG